MGCDYYIIKEVIIWYVNHQDEKDWDISEVDRERRYIDLTFDSDSEYDSDDAEARSKRAERQLKKEMDEVNDTPKKVLFEDGKWVKDAYKSTYSYLIPRNAKTITRVLKITKAVERN